jgi:hypothetical protein
VRGMNAQERKGGKKERRKKGWRRESTERVFLN